MIKGAKAAADIDCGGKTDTGGRAVPGERNYLTLRQTV